MVTTTHMGREKTFNIRFSDEEWARLDAVAQHYGLNAAAAIRMLLKRETDRIGPATRATFRGLAHDVVATPATGSLDVERIARRMARPVAVVLSMLDVARRMGRVERVSGEGADSTWEPRGLDATGQVTAEGLVAAFEAHGIDVDEVFTQPIADERGSQIVRRARMLAKKGAK